MEASVDQSRWPAPDARFGALVLLVDQYLYPNYRPRRKDEK